jgi:putative FmdB family regulatory protein
MKRALNSLINQNKFDCEYFLSQYKRTLELLEFLFLMPTYEYECLKCGKNFDFVQSMKDPALKTCVKEVCRMKKWGKGKVRRLLSSGAGLIFKGSGFYITDYRSDSYKQAAKKDSESPSSSTSTKTDSASIKKDNAASKKSSKNTSS